MLWKTGHVPERLLHATIISIFKKGDTQDCSNYRGISLMESLTKLVESVLAARLQNHLALSRVQGGFRRGEECAGMIASLYEICQRRALSGEQTVVCFLDLKKAFDLVPHGVLLYKCERAGICGRFFRFLCTLYGNPTSSVQVAGASGEPFLIGRGVRQGAPLSPLLFNLFIDDLPLALGAGIRVPGLEEEESRI
jgi:hypothetical protein